VWWSYGFNPEEICQGFRFLFGLPNINLANSHGIAWALQLHENGLDFADALHLVTSQHCNALYTFDGRFIKRAKKLIEFNVQQP
jgi:predicted nucleic acid-binding protein